MSNDPDYQKPSSPSQYPDPYKQPPYMDPRYIHSEMEVAAARMKSYTGAAVLVFFLYWLFFLPGLIVNFIYYQEAQRMQKLAGRSLPGQGCLAIMLWLNLFVLILTVLGGCGFLLLGVLASAM
ncbi:MAG: hypothetical protein KJ063_10075 [Anaerolineae bacterium]|nr:hypothetical protein [Anaerolineae bacterium]